MKVALVTGATRGIGKVIAQHLGAAGFATVVTGRTMAANAGRHDALGGIPIPGSVEETVASIAAAGGTAVGAHLDLLDRASIDAAIAATIARFGRLDVLVNNGIYQGPVILQSMMDADITEAERSMQGNFFNQFYLSRKALEIMLPQREGRIIFMSALTSVQPTAGNSGLFYNAPKAALNKIADHINFEHRKDGISAYLLEPRLTRTETLDIIMGDKIAPGSGAVARDPAETARTVAWLASHPDAPHFADARLINAPDFFAEHAEFLDGSATA